MAACTPATCDYTHPRGVHLYLQRTGSSDPTRTWVLTAPERTQFFFDGEGYQSAVVDNNGNTMSFVYERRRSNNVPTKFLQYVVDASGRHTLELDLYYTAPVDPQNLWKLHELSDRGGGVTHFDYVDPDGPTGARMHTTVTDAEEHVTRYVLDAFGRPDRTTDAKNQATTTGFSHDEFGQVIRTVDANGNPTLLSDYDATGQPQTVTDADGNAAHLSYDGRGNPLTVTDPLGHSRSWSYDLFTRVLATTEQKDAAAGDLIVTPAPVYDANVNITRHTKANFAVHTFSYDADDRVSSVLEPRDDESGAPERKTSFTYDKVGNRLTVTEPNGNLTTAAGDFTTTYGYDEIYQLVSVTDAAGHVTSYRSDGAGNLSTVVDGRKNATSDPTDFTASFSYTRDHQVSAVVDATGFSTRFGYDRDGLQTTVTDQNGSVSTTVYDPRGKVIETRVPHELVDGQVKETITRFEYEPVRRLGRSVVRRV